MRKRFYLLFSVVLVPYFLCAQEEGVDYQVGDLFFGIKTGIDYNMNAYKEFANNTGFEFFGESPHYNFGVDLAYMATSRLRPRIEFKFIKMSYGQYWSEEYASFISTKTKVNNMGINLHLDYALIHTNKFKFFLSPGLKYEFATGSKFVTEKTDGESTTSKFSNLGDYYPSNILGGAMATIFKYDLSENIGITFSPEYAVYFRGYQRDNSNLYQRLSANFGVELRFH